MSQIAIPGWRGIVSFGALAVAGAIEEAGGSKASVSRRNGGGKREECGGEELGLHGKRLLRYISNYLDIYPTRRRPVADTARGVGCYFLTSTLPP